MAEEKEELQPEEGKQERSKPGSKNLLIVIVILVLALAGGVFAYTNLSSGQIKQSLKA